MEVNCAAELTSLRTSGSFDFIPPSTVYNWNNSKLLKVSIPEERFADNKTLYTWHAERKEIGKKLMELDTY